MSSILSSVYISQTGLTGFSRALDTISNNVANLNTPGFKGGDLLLSDIRSNQDRFSQRRIGEDRGFGAGVTVSEERRRFTNGEIRQTGIPTNVAIDGNGFFVLNQNGETFFTRAGQFEFSSDGTLLESTSGAPVQAFQDGRLQDVNLDLLQTIAAIPTARVALAGNLSSDDTDHTVAGFTVIDSIGDQQTLNLNFTNNTAVVPGSWLITVTDSDSNTIAEGEIQFSPDGAPLQGANTLEFSLSAANGRTSTIALDFGQPGELDGTTSLAAGPDSDLATTEIDGTLPGVLTQSAFNANGELFLTFSNGQTRTGPQLALATFRNPQELESSGGRLFTSPNDQQVTIGRASEEGLGNIVGGSVELANVELSREFADIIILQRGFQASSQVLNISNELIEQVYNSLSGRG